VNFVFVLVLLAALLLAAFEIECIGSLGLMIMALTFGFRVFLQIRYRIFSKAGYHRTQKVFGPDGKPTVWYTFDLIFWTALGLFVLYVGLPEFTRSCL
jgi:hypothetical protein